MLYMGNSGFWLFCHIIFELDGHKCILWGHYSYEDVAVLGANIIYNSIYILI